LKTRVLDSWPILEWIQDRQPAAGIVLQLLTEAQGGTTRVFVSAINIGEVYYVLRKHHADELAEQWRRLSQTLPATIEVPTYDDIWDAALLKGKYRIAYADAFAAALAQKLQCPVVTGDPEFRVISGLQLEWIGKTI
jgi:uncharacterized protein